MTIRQLRTLVAVADHKTFSAAAEVVNVTHAAVSQQMQSLEAELGVILFDRTPRTPALTPVARQIVEKARLLIADYDTLVPSLLEQGGLSGILTLGVMRTTLTGLTARAVAAFKTKYPKLGLHIRPGLTMALLSDIKRGQLDGAVISKPHLLPAGVVFRELTKEPLRLIAAPSEKEKDPIYLLQNRPFIRFDRNAVVGALIDSWIISNQIKVTETMELDSPEAIASMVHANLGVSIVPDLSVKPQDSLPVTSINLGPDAPSRVLGLVYREQDAKTHALEELYETLTSVILEAA